MKRRYYYDDYDRDLPLSRDPIRGRLGGVCAGIARRLDFTPCGVRLAAIVGLFLAPHIVIGGYILLYLILDERV